MPYIYTYATNWLVQFVGLWMLSHHISCAYSLYGRTNGAIILLWVSCLPCLHAGHRSARFGGGGPLPARLARRVERHGARGAVLLLADGPLGALGPPPAGAAAAVREHRAAGWQAGSGGLLVQVMVICIVLYYLALFCCCLLFLFFLFYLFFGCFFCLFVLALRTENLHAVYADTHTHTYIHITPFYLGVCSDEKRTPLYILLSLLHHVTA